MADPTPQMKAIVEAAREVAEAQGFVTITSGCPAHEIMVMFFIRRAWPTDAECIHEIVDRLHEMLVKGAKVHVVNLNEN